MRDENGKAFDAMMTVAALICLIIMILEWVVIR